ncbi:hypothetical protein cypCar_00007424 [Cyprinus carpio]|nr:hypothetical protein cypCar_00007424 [Cyprinus carpio]
MSQLLHMEIPNFGSTVLDSLNEQRLLGQHCDVAIMVNGQAFKAHRAVLAASSLYFRDLFSGSAQTLFELPSSVAPSCFQQILSFCYTGRMTVSASDQLMVMYTAGYLQIQNIVERGMDLMFKASAPYCDSQTSATDDPPSPNNNNSSLLLGDQPTTVCKIKEEKLETLVCAQNGELKHSEEDRRPRGRSSRNGTLFYTSGGVNGVIPVMHAYELSTRDHASPGASSLPTTDSPTSHQNEEEDFEDDSYESLTNGKIFGGSSGIFGMQEKMEVSSLPLSLENRFCVLLGGDREALPAGLISQIGYRCHPALYTEGDPGERLELIAVYCQNFAPNFKESEMNVIAADMCTNARRVRKRWLPKIKSMLPEAIEVYRGTAVLSQVEGATQPGGGFPFESEFKHLAASNLTLEQHLYGDCRETLRNGSHFNMEERSQKGEEAKTEPSRAKEPDNPQEVERLPESPERAASVLALNPASKKGEKEHATSSPRSQREEQTRQRPLEDDQ